jgi:hypothetical protein
MSRWRQDNLNKVFRDVPHFLHLISGLVNYSRPRRSPFTLFQIKHLHQASSCGEGGGRSGECGRHGLHRPRGGKIDILNEKKLSALKKCRFWAKLK